MAYYRDFREYLKVLEAHDKIYRIDRLMCKDTEVHPLVRWQFRGMPEVERKAFWFEHVTDAKGRRYQGSLAVGALAASRDIFALAMQSTPDQVFYHLTESQRRSIAPEVVTAAPCREEIHQGSGLFDHGGLEEFPIPISTPGFDVAPYTTYSHWVSRDPETGVHNIGNYRGQLKAPGRMGIFSAYPQHLNQNWVTARRLGRPLDAALVIGATPNISFAANTKLPYEVDEYAVAGAVAGEPVPVIQGLTVDLWIPATAEIVVEGKIRVDEWEPEAPFGETTGYMGQEVMGLIFEVTAIYHRRQPIMTSILSQFPPSESTKLRQMSYEPTFYKFLRYDCNQPFVRSVAFLESCSSYYYCVIQVQKKNPAQPWQALAATMGYDSGTPKVVVVVDEDIDPRDADAINWAIASRCQPHRDVRIWNGRTAVMDLSAVPPTVADLGTDALYPPPNGCSALLIDATRKWEYPPVSLPRKEYMERSLKIWEELGLPALQPKSPWFGYELGYWPKEYADAAQWAVQGDYQKTGAWQAGRREPTTE